MITWILKGVHLDDGYHQKARALFRVHGLLIVLVWLSITESSFWRNMHDDRDYVGYYSPWTN